MKALYRHKESGDIFAIETDERIENFQFRVSSFEGMRRIGRFGQSGRDGRGGGLDLHRRTRTDTDGEEGGFRLSIVY